MTTPASTPRPWMQAWQDALYGPSGFYRRAEGPAGHFATSAQGIPGVGQVLAQAMAAYAERCDAEVVVDFACGRGEMLDSLTPFVAPTVDLVGVDVVERPAAVSERVTWVRSPGGAVVPPLEVLAGRRALVVAHEWLDVVPATVAELDDAGTWRRVLVTPEGDEHLGEPLDGDELAWLTRLVTPADGANDDGGPASPAPPGDPRPGDRAEIGLARDGAWRALVRAVRAHGAPGSLVLGIDYVMTPGALPPFGTLTGFRDGVETAPVPDGSCDITSHVAVHTLDLTAPWARQRDVLLDLFGSAPLEPVPLDLATRDPADYLGRLALRSAFATAVAPGGLGDFAWFLHETA